MALGSRIIGRLCVVMAWSALLSACSHGGAPESATAYACNGSPTPSSTLAAIGGSVLVSGICFFTGDLILDGTGTTAIVADAATFNLTGNLKLAGNTSFKSTGGVFRLENHFVFQYAVTAADQASFTLQDAELSTNDGTIAGTTTSSYNGSGSSSLSFSNVSIDLMHSWLLASASDSASITVADSKAPVEIYPSDAAHISISGPTSNMKVWLDFESGLSASITGLPDSSTPYTFSIGASTPATATVSTNVKFQIDVVNATASFGFVSHPGSSLTMISPQGPTAYDVYFQDPAAPINIAGGFVVSQGAPLSTSLTDSGRTLQLTQVPLTQLSWQVYSYASAGTSPPVTITGSTSDATKFVTLNEVGSFNGGNFILDTVTALWATLTAEGTGSIAISHSQIASQTILALDTSRIAIADSTVYGSLFQARAGGVVTLVNTPLLQVNAVPVPPPAGFPALAQNITMADPTAFPVFVTDSGGGTIAAATLASPGSVPAGSMLTFRGDAFVESQVTPQCTFQLSYQPSGASSFTPINSAGVCPKLSRNAGDGLGSLDTTGLASGAYTAKLEIFIAGSPALVAPTSFTIQ